MIEEYFRDDMCGRLSHLGEGPTASHVLSTTAAAQLPDAACLPSCYKACGDEAQRRSDRHRGRGKSLVVSVGKKRRRVPTVLLS